MKKKIITWHTSDVTIAFSSLSGPTYFYAAKSSQNSGPEIRFMSEAAPTLASVAAFFNQHTFGFLACSGEFQIHLVHSGLF